MEEYGLELLNERKGDVFSIVNEIFEFGSFLKGDEQENGNKEDKQENLKECIKKYNKVKKSEEYSRGSLEYFFIMSFKESCIFSGYPSSFLIEDLKLVLDILQ